MKTLIFGAGPLGTLYAYLLHKAGKDVTILARNKRLDYIRENGVVLKNEFTGKKVSADVKVVGSLGEDDAYDLIIVVMRKNKLVPVLNVLARNKMIKNILFMGNNCLGFENYFKYLPKEKLLFGFGSAGGGLIDNVVCYVDKEKPGGKRMPVIIGEHDGKRKERTRSIQTFFESAQIPVEIKSDIDGWLKYHMALVFPMLPSLLKHNFDPYQLAENKADIRICIRAFKEAGNVLQKLGYKRQPFKLNMFYWMPEFMVVKIFQQILKSKFAEIAFAMHARAASDEFKEHGKDFKSISEKTGIKTKNFDDLRVYIS